MDFHNIHESDIHNYIQGTTTDIEKERVLKWLTESDENLKFYFDLKALWYSDKVKYYAETRYLESALQRFHQKARTSERQKYLRFTDQRYAAAILFFIVISTLLLLNQIKINKESELITITVPSDGLIQVFDLNDGTRVWLNKNSTFKYPGKFRGKERSVILDGEAFFDVSKNPDKPFKIQTPSSLVIRVYGTSFNVKAFSTDHQVTTTLVTGTVVLQDTKKDDLITLKPGNQAIYDDEISNITVGPVIPDHFIAWQKGVKLLHDASLKEITQTIESLYNVKTKFDTTQILKKEYNFVIRQEQSLDTVMEMLKFVAPIKYNFTENKILEISTN